MHMEQTESSTGFFLVGFVAGFVGRYAFVSVSYLFRVCPIVLCVPPAVRTPYVWYSLAPYMYAIRMVRTMLGVCGCLGSKLCIHRKTSQIPLQGCLRSRRRRRGDRRACESLVVFQVRSSSNPAHPHGAGTGQR